MWDRMLSFLVAVSLAFLVWLYARSRDPEVLDNVAIAVEVTLTPRQTEQFDLEVTGPHHIPVSFRGPSSRIHELRDMLQRGEVEVAVTVVVPEDRKNENRYLDTVRVDATDVHVPPGVTALVVEGRNRIPITLRRLIQRRLPVRLDPAPEDRVSQVVVEPATVLVRGPKVILDRVRFIPTQPQALPLCGDMAADQEMVNTGPIPLVREMDGRPVVPLPDVVTVRMTYKPQEKVHEVKGIPIQFLCPANFPLRPRYLDGQMGRIDLRVVGPAEDAPVGIVAFLDLTGRNFKPGFYANEPLRLQLPKDFHLAQEPPRSAVFELTSDH